MNKTDKTLSKIYDWYTALEFNNETPLGQVEYIQKGLRLSGLFDLDLSDYSSLSRKSRDMFSKLKDVYTFYFPPQHKVALINEKGEKLFEQLIYIDKYSGEDSELVNDYLEAMYLSTTMPQLGIKALQITKYLLDNMDLNNFAFLETKNRIIELIHSVVVTPESGYMIDELTYEICSKLISNSRNGNTTLGRAGLSYLICLFSNLNMKFDITKRMLDKGIYSDDLLNLIISSIPNKEDRIAFARRIIEYDERCHTEYFKSFMLGFVIKSDKDLETEEDANKLFELIHNLMEDPLFSKYVDSNTICVLFENIHNDQILINNYKKVTTDPKLSKFVDKNVFRMFLYNLEDDKLKLQVYKYGIENDLISPYMSSNFFSESIKDRSLLCDYNIMKPIYEHPKFALSIASVLSLRGFTHSIDELFKKDEKKYISEGKLKQLLEKYSTVGLIHEDTLDRVYEITSKYMRNYTRQDMLFKIANSPNTREILEDITRNHRTMKINDVNTYEEGLREFAIIFPKSRFSNMIDKASFDKMSIEQKEKFNLKVWDTLLQNPLFNKDDNTKKALVQVIAMAGLFENDEHAQDRLRQVIRLFSNYLTNPISFSDMILYISLNDDWFNEYFDTTQMKSYRLRKDASIPPDLEGILSKNISVSEMNRLKRETGNLGSSITKFISPYVKTEGGWTLRNGIDISRFNGILKPFMTDADFDALFFFGNTPKEVLNFLNPYEEVRETGYVLKKNLPASKYSEIVEKILKSGLSDRYTFSNIHLMFDGMEQTYDEEFFKFFIDNQNLILEMGSSQQKLAEVKKKYSYIKKFFAERGNNNPTFKDMVKYLDEIPYITTFGNEEFASDAKNTNVSDDGYTYYEELLKDTRCRYLTTIPRHEKTYEIVGQDGKTYKILTKVLRSDDPFNLLVGESKYTNCCQKFGQAGEECMKHAATNPNGGIFATYLVTDEGLVMLTQSWIWSNESRLCLDNVEATDVITTAPREKCDNLSYLVRSALRLSANDMMDTSKEVIDKYIEEQTRIINASSKTPEEKKTSLEALELLRRRQTLKVVTVGEGCDDVDVHLDFEEIERESKSYGPKGYHDYRDSKPGQQHVITRSDEEELPMDPEYVDIPVFRDKRRIAVEKGPNIRFDTLRQITDIGEIAHRKEMMHYKDSEGNFTAYNQELLGNLYDTEPENLRVLHGEDWYIVYSETDGEIKLHDIAKKDSRIGDEGLEQTVEIVKGLDKVLKDAVVLDGAGHVSMIKPIKADLREDTAYILYLVQKQRGLIEQVGDDLLHKYGEDDKEVVTLDKQKELLSKFNEIKGQSDLNMHEVTFIPGERIIDEVVNSKEEIKTR